MAYPVGTFSSFIVIKKPQSVVIKARPARAVPEMIGAFAIYWLPILLLISLLQLPSVYTYSISAIVAFILMLMFDTYLMGVVIAILDKKEGMFVEMGMDKFEAKIDEIKDVSIVEEMAKEGTAAIKLYRFKYILPDGEKTSGFAFTSYNKLDELLNLLKSASSTHEAPQLDKPSTE